MNYQNMQSYKGDLDIKKISQFLIDEIRSTQQQEL